MLKKGGRKNKKRRAGRSPRREHIRISTPPCHKLEEIESMAAHQVSPVQSGPGIPSQEMELDESLISEILAPLVPLIDCMAVPPDDTLSKMTADDTKGADVMKAGAHADSLCSSSNETQVEKCLYDMDQESCATLISYTPAHDEVTEDASGKGHEDNTEDILSVSIQQEDEDSVQDVHLMGNFKTQIEQGNADEDDKAKQESCNPDVSPTPIRQEDELEEYEEHQFSTRVNEHTSGNKKRPKNTMETSSQRKEKEKTRSTQGREQMSDKMRSNSEKITTTTKQRLYSMSVSSDSSTKDFTLQQRIISENPGAQITTPGLADFGACEQSELLAPALGTPVNDKFGNIGNSLQHADLEDRMNTVINDRSPSNSLVTSDTMNGLVEAHCLDLKSPYSKPLTSKNDVKRVKELDPKEERELNGPSATKTDVVNDYNSELKGLRKPPLEQAPSFAKWFKDKSPDAMSIAWPYLDVALINSLEAQILERDQKILTLERKLEPSNTPSPPQYESGPWLSVIKGDLELPGDQDRVMHDCCKFKQGASFGTAKLHEDTINRLQAVIRPLRQDNMTLKEDLNHVSDIKKNAIITIKGLSGENEALHDDMMTYYAGSSNENEVSAAMTPSGNDKLQLTPCSLKPSQRYESGCVAENLLGRDLLEAVRHGGKDSVNDTCSSKEPLESNYVEKLEEENRLLNAQLQEHIAGIDTLQHANAKAQGLLDKIKRHELYTMRQVELILDDTVPIREEIHSNNPKTIWNRWYGGSSVGRIQLDESLRHQNNSSSKNTELGLTETLPQHHQASNLVWHTTLKPFHITQVQRPMKDCNTKKFSFYEPAYQLKSGVLRTCKNRLIGSPLRYYTSVSNMLLTQLAESSLQEKFLEFILCETLVLRQNHHNGRSLRLKQTSPTLKTFFSQWDVFQTRRARTILQHESDAFFEIHEGELNELYTEELAFSHEAGRRFYEADDACSISNTRLELPGNVILHPKPLKLPDDARLVPTAGTDEENVGFAEITNQERYNLSDIESLHGVSASREFLGQSLGHISELAKITETKVYPVALANDDDKNVSCYAGNKVVRMVSPCIIEGGSLEVNGSKGTAISTRLCTADNPEELCREISCPAFFDNSETAVVNTTISESKEERPKNTDFNHSLFLSSWHGSAFKDTVGDRRLATSDTFENENENECCISLEQSDLSMAECLSAAGTLACINEPDNVDSDDADQALSLHLVPTTTKSTSSLKISTRMLRMMTKNLWSDLQEADQKNVALSSLQRKFFDSIKVQTAEIERQTKQIESLSNEVEKQSKEITMLVQIISEAPLSEEYCRAQALQETDPFVALAINFRRLVLKLETRRRNGVNGHEKILEELRSMLDCGNSFIDAACVKEVTDISGDPTSDPASWSIQYVECYGIAPSIVEAMAHDSLVCHIANWHYNVRSWSSRNEVPKLIADAFQQRCQRVLGKLRHLGNIRYHDYLLELEQFPDEKIMLVKVQKQYDCIVEMREGIKMISSDVADNGGDTGGKEWRDWMVDIGLS